MGLIIDKNKKNENIQNNTNNVLIIGTLYIELDDTAGKDTQIQKMLIYIIDNKIDILCLQGFVKFSIICEFVNKLENIMKEKYANIKLYYAPQISLENNEDINSFDLTWSSNNENENENIDCIIISTYPILNFSKIKFIHHLDLINSPKYIILANINYNNILISVYSLSLQENLVGIRNTTIRKQQIEQLKSIILTNKSTIKNDLCINNIKNQNIHIMCGNLNINEIENDVINKEYINIFRKMKFIDTYKYVMKYKQLEQNDSTNIYGFRTSYITIFAEHIDTNNTNNTNNIIDYITHYLHDNYGLLIINSNIIHLEGFDNFIIKSSFVISDLHITNSSPIINKIITNEL